MRIRATAAADLAPLAAIYAHHVRTGTASFELEPPGEAAMRERWERLVEQGYPHLVAEQSSDLLGYAYASSYRPRPAYRWTVEDSVYVAPGCEGRGVGGGLLARLIEHCTALGYRQMVAVIGGRDHRASIALHEAAGFMHAGTLTAVGYKHGRWLDTVLMQRALGAADRHPPETGDPP